MIKTNKKYSPNCCILLAAYNGEDFIERQIKSILKQIDVQVQIYVSIDDSSDNTEEVLRSLKKENEKTLHFKRGKFGSAAKNFYSLIKNTKLEGFDYIAFSDQDDVWFEDKLIDAITSMERNSAQGFSSDVISFWPVNGKKRLIKNSHEQTTIDHLFESPGPGCSQVFTAKSFRKFQNFLKIEYELIQHFHYHDWLTYAFYRENSLKWLISSNAKMLYVQHESNEIGSNTGFRAAKKRFRMIYSGWYRKQVFILAKLFDKTEMKSSFSKFAIQNVFNFRRKTSQSLIVFILWVLRIF